MFMRRLSSFSAYYGWLACLLPGLLGSAACQPREGREEVRERLLMRSSFEELTGWYPDVIPSLTTEKTHSGRYALRIDTLHPYSATFRATLGSLSPQRPRRLTLSAWVWVPTWQDDARLVLEIKNADATKTILSKHIFLSTTGPFADWKKVSRSFDIPSYPDADLDNDSTISCCTDDLPANIHHNYRLLVYLWNGSARQPVYTDDWELTELR